MISDTNIKLIECPRDAMQGIKTFIPTSLKVTYLNHLLQAGFHTLDFGSFVSPKAIPQMSDTAEVLSQLNISASPTRLLAIVANERGARAAASQEKISDLGFPLSVSETFQQRNTNSSIAQSLERVKAIQELCLQNNKSLVIYISMGFGNPYGDPWSAGLVLEQAEKIISMGITTLSLADTVGMATSESIRYLFNRLIPAFPDTDWGAHLHTHPHNWKEKIEAAWDSGCRRFDGTLGGYGGCPMASDALIGNMATENLLQYIKEKGIRLPLNVNRLQKSIAIAGKMFTSFR